MTAYPTKCKPSYCQHCIEDNNRLVYALGFWLCPDCVDVLSRKGLPKRKPLDVTRDYAEIERLTRVLQPGEVLPDVRTDFNAGHSSPLGRMGPGDLNAGLWRLQKGKGDDRR